MINRFFILIGLLAISCSPIKKSNFVISQIPDGDTVLDEKLNRFELAYIDAPEREQPFGLQAKNFLNEKAFDSGVDINITGDKKLEIFIKGQSLNLLMVEQGYAWASPNISDPVRALAYNEAQKNAIRNMSGLWALGHGLMVAPWQWRQQGTQQSSSRMEMQRLAQQSAKQHASKIQSQKIDLAQKLKQEVKEEQN
jgi:endonuclease YncB( thermonuclease family)